MREEVQEILDYDWTGPRKHSHLSMDKRAAQFNPFAALTGYGDEIREEGRFTEEKPELTEDQKRQIDIRLQEAGRRPGTRLKVKSFRGDLRKKGGLVQTLTGILSAISPQTACDRGHIDLIVENVGTVSISLDDILDVEEI